MQSTHSSALLNPWRVWRRSRLYRPHAKKLLVFVFCIGVCLQGMMTWNGLLLFSVTTPPVARLILDSRVTVGHSPVSRRPLLYLRANVDNRTREQLQDVVARVYNLPPRYGLEKLQRQANKCAKYPSLMELSFNNMYWQVLHSSNGTFYLYSAFFDNRTLTEPGPSIRILGMANRIKPAVSTHCQMWYDGIAAPVVAKVVEYRYIWARAYGNYRNGILQPYLMQCVIPESHRQRIPQSVSLVEGSCDKPTNNLRVVHNLPPQGRKENFAVCVKGLDIDEDITLRLVEWLELLFLLGSDKVFLYDLEIHPNISKVLRHYESEGRVDVKSLTLPGEQPNVRGLVRRYLKAKITHKRQNELIPYNDCLYRNMNRYKFIVLLDIDEVIMTRTVPSWKELMEQLAPETMLGEDHPRSSYYARNVYFLDAMQEKHGWAVDVPRFMHMLQHVHRAANYTKPGSYIKAFHDPQRVQTVHNHFPLSCLKGGCSNHPIPTELAHLQHYRPQCVGELRKVCPYYHNHTVLDDAILRFKEPLLRGTLHTLRQLGFLQKGQDMTWIERYEQLHV